MSVESFREFSMRHENKPLDLLAVEARLHDKSMRLLPNYRASVLEQDIKALFTHCRALRTALKDYVSYANSINVPHGCSCEQCYRARTVLAQATDEEGK